MYTICFAVYHMLLCQHCNRKCTHVKCTNIHVVSILHICCCCQRTQGAINSLVDPSLQRIVAGITTMEAQHRTYINTACLMFLHHSLMKFCYMTTYMYNTYHKYYHPLYCSMWQLHL